jgi:DNA-binding transcriptional MerR regulator
LLNISAVEREAGLSKDVLRMWERRYGFPKPLRDDNGERRYSVAEIAKLRAIKRLMDVGLRPGKIIHHTQEELDALAEGRITPRREQAAPAVEGEILELLARHDAPALQNAFANLLMRQGLQRTRDADLSQPLSAKPDGGSLRCPWRTPTQAMVHGAPNQRLPRQVGPRVR